MDQYRYDELHLKVSLHRRAEFIVALERALTRGWRRALDAESRASSSEMKRWYFECTEDGERPAALLAVYSKEGEMLYVSNVVPKKKNYSFSPDEYNSVIRDFHQKIVGAIVVPFAVGTHWKQMDVPTNTESRF